MTAEALQAAVEAKVREGLKSAAQEIIETTSQKYDDCVNYFYNSYDPDHYARSYSLYEAKSEYYADLGNGFEAGVKANPSVMATTHDPSEYVFYGAWHMGVHGTSAIKRRESLHQTMAIWQLVYKAQLPEIVKRHIGQIKL